MRRYGRKVTPRVVDGKVQRKNRSELTSNYWNTEQPYPVIDRERPGKGYRHLLRKEDVCSFIDLLPDWSDLSQGLNAIVLAEGSDEMDGFHTPGVVGLCAWERELWRCCDRDHYDEHAELYAKLGVSISRKAAGLVLQFTEPQARAFQLVHVLLHELGHHHDRMTTRSKRTAARGERFAEQYARQYESLIWDRYLDAFDV
jgi:hypothetical protein